MCARSYGVLTLPRPAASITVFVILMSEYFLRYLTDRPIRKANKDPNAEEAYIPARGATTPKMRLMIVCVLMMTFFLIIRCVNL